LCRREGKSSPKHSNSLLKLTDFDIRIALTRTYVTCHSSGKLRMASEPFAALEAGAASSGPRLPPSRYGRGRGCKLRTASDPFATVEGGLRDESQCACHAERSEASGRRTESLSRRRTAGCTAISSHKPDSSAAPQNDTQAVAPQHDSRKVSQLEYYRLFGCAFFLRIPIRSALMGRCRWLVTFQATQIAHLPYFSSV